ncbi:MAG: alpha-E domain-containing protein [Leucothrix sp.]
MLSRNAERIYWMGRYIERTEDTARLLHAYSHVMLDLPTSGQLGWDVLLKIMASETLFYEYYEDANEDNVIKFLLDDIANPSSIRSAVRAARENARTLKDRLPLEGWEILNDLNLFIKKGAEGASRQRNRFQFLKDIIIKCHCFNGLVRTTLSRNQTYEFLCMGGFIERADMNTRTLDVAADILLKRSDEDGVFDTHIWMEILKAQNAVMMYRMKNGPRSSPKVVLRFLIGENEFPRSIKHCVGALGGLTMRLPECQLFIDKVREQKANLDTFIEADEFLPVNLRAFFDETQQGLNELHSIIATTWFLSAQAPETAITETQTPKQSQGETS